MKNKLEWELKKNGMKTEGTGAVGSARLGLPSLSSTWRAPPLALGMLADPSWLNTARETFRLPLNTTKLLLAEFSVH